MVESLVFTLLVAAGDGESPATRAILEALGEALGTSFTVVARETEGPIPDALALELERQTDSAVVATLTWQGPSRLEARVRLHLRDADRWVERGITFAPSDDLRERGRTLGFTMASMLPGQGAPLTSPARGPPPIIAAVSAAPSVGRMALDAVLTGSLGVGGNADAVGGAFAGRRALTSALAVRAELAGRSGVVQAAQATSLSLHLAVGLVWSPLGDSATRRGNVAVRSDLALFYESIGHLSEDDIDRVRRSRFLPGGDLMLEGSLRVLGSAAIVLGIGAEVAFGRTDIYVHERKVAVLPPLRLVSSLGLRHYF